MAITDAQFQAWLETSRQRTSLFNLSYVGSSGGVATTYVFRVSNGDYGPTGAAETPANTIYENCVAEVPSFSQRMSEQLEGRTNQSTGDLLIFNPNGERNLLLRMHWDGGVFEHYIGDPSWPIADFRIARRGVIFDIFDAGNAKLGFKVMDKGALLDRPVMTSVLGGDGPEATTPCPLILGERQNNIKPKLYDKTNLIYKFTAADATTVPWHRTDVFNLTNTNSPTDVREDGKSLRGVVFFDSTSTLTVGNYHWGSWDIANSTIVMKSHGFVENTRLWLAAVVFGSTFPSPLVAYDSGVTLVEYWVVATGLTADRFRLAATRGGTPLTLTGSPSGQYVFYYFNWTSTYSSGTFQLAAAPSQTGIITCDTQGIAAAATLNTLRVDQVGAIIKQVLTSNLTNTPYTVADLDTTNLAAFDPSSGSLVRYVGCYLPDTITFSELLDRLMLSVGGWWHLTRAGLLTIGRLTLPVAGTPVYSFISDDMAVRTLKLARRILPRRYAIVRGDKNYTPQEKLAGDTASYDVERYHAQWYYESKATAVPASWTEDPSYHVNAAFPEPQDTYLTNANSVAEAERVAIMHQQPTGIYTFNTHQIVFFLELGNRIYVETDKFTGYGTVVGIDERIKGQSTIDFFARVDNYYPGQI